MCFLVRTYQKKEGNLWLSLFTQSDIKQEPHANQLSQIILSASIKSQNGPECAEKRKGNSVAIFLRGTFFPVL